MGPRASREILGSLHTHTHTHTDTKKDERTCSLCVYVCVREQSNAAEKTLKQNVVYIL